MHTTISIYLLSFSAKFQAEHAEPIKFPLDFETALPISNFLRMVQSGRYQPGIVSALVQLPPISKVAGILIPDCLVQYQPWYVQVASISLIYPTNICQSCQYERGPPHSSSDTQTIGKGLKEQYWFSFITIYNIQHRQHHGLLSIQLCLYKSILFFSFLNIIVIMIMIITIILRPSSSGKQILVVVRGLLLQCIAVSSSSSLISIVFIFIAHQHCFRLHCQVVSICSSLNLAALFSSSSLISTVFIIIIKSSLTSLNLSTFFSSHPSPSMTSPHLTLSHPCYYHI